MDIHHLAEHLRVALSSLPETERQVLSWRYGIGNANAHSPTSLSKHSGPLPQRIAAREASGIGKPGTTSDRGWSSGFPTW